jgi:hypothetical protein
VADLERYFAINGYSRASTVSERGEFAIRGGVIDVYPPAAEEPVRLDLFGDTLESIRAFDPETQRSTKQLREIQLLPVSEALLDKEGVSRFRNGYIRAFGAPGDDPLYATISEGGRRAGLEHWLPLFYERMATLFDYLPDGALIGVDHQVTESRDERLAMIADAYDARASADRKSAYRPLAPDALYLTAKEWDAAVEDRPNRKFTPFQPQGLDVVDMGAKLGRTFAAERAQDSVNLFEATADHARKLAGEGKRVLFASWSEGSSERLGTMLADHGLKKIPYAAYWQAAKANDPKTPQRVVLPLDNGFETESLAVISETDILGDRLARPRKKRRAANFLAEASALTPGDLVVHIDHGIGRYEGLKTLDVQGAPHDCLDLLYGGEAKLYLPVENIDLLTRYGTDAENVQLDKLGGAAWQGRKAKAKERLRVMAEGLIQIAAARQLKSVEETDPPHGVFDEFCARFPYEETDDQLSAIARRAGGPVVRQADGPADLRRRRLRQDRGRPARGLRGGDERQAGGHRLPDHAAGPPALQDLQGPLPGLAGQGHPPVAPGHRQGSLGDPRRPGQRPVRDRGRHPRHPVQAGVVQGPGPGHRRRGAALRGQAQGEAQGASRRRAHADPDRHADPAHPADGAVGHPGDVDHRHPAGRSPGGAHLHQPVRPGHPARGPAAREVSRRPGLLRGAAHQGPGGHREVPPHPGAGDQVRGRPWPDGPDPAGRRDDRLLRGPVRRAPGDDDRRERAGHPVGQHPDRPPRRHVRPGPALPDPRPGRPVQGPGLRLSDHARPRSRSPCRPRSA